MDYILKDWEKKMSAFASSVEKDLTEIRKCKADMQEMRQQMQKEVTGTYYVRDMNRIILSAPEIILGNVDPDGVLYDCAASNIVLRGTAVELLATGNGGRVETRAACIRQTAEDPGCDGNEHVLGPVSQVVSQARSIVIQSDDAEDAFTTPPAAIGGVRIHADKMLEISASQLSESKEELLDEQISGLEDRKAQLTEQVASHKESFNSLISELEELMKKKEKLVEKEYSIRAKYDEVEELNYEVESATDALAVEARSYSDVLAILSETNRLLKSLKSAKSKIKKGDAYLKQSTGSSLSIVGERIGIASADGEGNLRDNEDSGIAITANKVAIAAVNQDGSLKENGQVNIQAKTIEVATAGTADAAYDDNSELTAATYTAEGDFTLKSKNITIESVDYEVADKKFKEKQLTADSKIKLRAKTIEVSTEASANVEVDDEGKLTKANYTAEGDIIVKSKTFTLESTDTDIENGEAKEKALTAEGKVAIRAEKMDLSATDTEGKATGSVNINAKAVAVKSMDVEKEKRTDDKLAEGSTMTLVAEKMYVGAKSKDIKSKKLQAVSEEMGLFADKTFEAQQDEGKAVLQLDGGNANVGGSKTAVYGETTINGKTDIKGDVTAPKATIDNIEAKSSFKSTNISDGIAVPCAAAGGSLSAKLKTEDAPKE